MAKVASKILGWTGPADAVAYRFRIVLSGTPFDYALPVTVEVPVDPNNVQQKVDLAGTNLAEGKYDIYCTSVDAGGNESDPLESAGAVLDFNPPAPPSDLVWL